MMYFCPWRLFLNFILANSADPDEMPPYMPEYLFTEIQNEKD